MHPGACASVAAFNLALNAMPPDPQPLACVQLETELAAEREAAQSVRHELNQVLGREDKLRDELETRLAAAARSPAQQENARIKERPHPQYPPFLLLRTEISVAWRTYPG